MYTGISIKTSIEGRLEDPVEILHSFHTESSHAKPGSTEIESSDSDVTPSSPSSTSGGIEKDNKNASDELEQYKSGEP